MKKAAAGIMALALLMCLTTAYAGNAGSSADPLISKSYLTDTYMPDMNALVTGSVEESLGNVYDAAVGALQSAKDSYLAGTGGAVNTFFASSYDKLDVPAGATVTLYTGASVVLVTGSGSLTVSSGAVVDISAGSEIASGASLAKNKRYFCAEDTVAVFTAAEFSAVAVNGLYAVSDGVEHSMERYTDVNTDDWFYTYIKYIADKELYYGIDVAEFKPNEPMSRAMLVYSLWRLAGEPAASADTVFTDLTADWYKTAVYWAEANGIVNGFGDNTFRPDKSVTREQIAAVFYRYAGYCGTDTSRRNDLAAYTDAGLIADWAIEEMKWANARGLITGVSADILRPQGTATRAQVAAMIMRYAES